MALDVDTSAAPSDAGRAHPRPWLRAMGRAAAVAADTGDVSVSGLAGIIQWPWTLTRPQRPSDAGRAHPRPWLRVHEDAGPLSLPIPTARIIV
jgi:hypothetical protein